MTKQQLIIKIKELTKNNMKPISKIQIVNIDRFLEIRSITYYVTKFQKCTKSELEKMYKDLQICLQAA